MAADALARRALEHVVLVARRAGLGRVGADEREHGGVIERRAGAAEAWIGGAVAAFARAREAGGHVVRVLRAVVVGLMAADTVPRRAFVDVVLVTRRARLRRVQAHEREHAVVAEGARSRVAPRGIVRPMARLARRRESGGGVVRRLCRRVVLLMAADAGDRCRLELRGAVARLARQRSVRLIERDTGLRAVIPPDGGPRRRAMALLALRAEARLVAVVFAANPVAVEARLRRSRVLPVQVARFARDGLVLAVEAEARRVVKRAVRRLELRGRVRRREQHHERRRGEPSERRHPAGSRPASRLPPARAGHGWWHLAQSGPSAPRCTSR